MDNASIIKLHLGIEIAVHRSFSHCYSKNFRKFRGEVQSTGKIRKPDLSCFTRYNWIATTAA